ncbi:hypothetical protein GA0070606_5389 [Micromonospora citrea]|uniref:Uncharacterized protein n=1 Tax=Micromonospora citrea TaxID=47855 RepID=A0A1C6VVM4_9ACTN|nr:hypothetical protein [Micromonospora citrea]SCL70408.1 hypothetical protein GA0070606_5389 [Micromonospora citrea]
MVVGEHLGAKVAGGVADVKEGLADLVVVPSAAGLGFGKQSFERIAAICGSGGDVAGAGVRSTRTARRSRPRPRPSSWRQSQI